MRRLVSVAVLVLVGGCSGGLQDQAATSPMTTAATGTAAATATAMAVPVGECSAARAKNESPEPQGLPKEVAKTRTLIIQAAVHCEYDTLQKLAFEGADSFSYSFGEPTDPDDGEPARYWERQEDDDTPALDTLVRLLRLRPGRTSTGDGRVYVWPAAAAGDAPSDKQREAVEEAFRDEDVDAWFADEGYVGPRVGITGEADWLYYVAGGD